MFLLSGADSITLDTINQNLSAWTEYHLTVDKSRIKDPSNVKIVFEAFEPQGADARNVVEFAIDGFSITDGISTAVLSKDQVVADLKVYPSIWTNQFTIQTTPYHADRKVQLIDQVGRLVYEAKLLKNDISLTVQPAIPTGIYFVRLMKSNGEVGAAVKVVKVE